MKISFSLFLIAAAVSAASPQLLKKVTRNLHDRAVYPQEGQVCCRTDGKNCVSLPT
ncbi:ec1 protein [Colletotrichum incanum]|nr:ec1 protein [Colletotrichum incanum]